MGTVTVSSSVVMMGAGAVSCFVDHLIRRRRPRPRCLMFDVCRDDWAVAYTKEGDIYHNISGSRYNQDTRRQLGVELGARTLFTRI